MTDVTAEAEKPRTGARTAKPPKVTGADVAEQIVTDVDNLKGEVRSLATLIHSIKDDAPDGTIRGTKLTNALARLEKLEQQVQGEHGLLNLDRATEGTFVALRHDLDRVTDAVNQLSGGDLAGLYEHGKMLTAKLAELRKVFDGYSAPATVQTVMSEIKQLRDHVDAVSKAPPGLDTVASSMRDSLTDYVDSRVAGLAPMVERLANDLSARIGQQAERVDSLATALGATAVKTGPAVGDVYDRVLALMDEVDHIGKDRHASGGGVSYKFRGIEDAQNAVGAAMRKVRVLLRPEVVSWEYGTLPVEGVDAKGKPRTVVWATSRLTMRYTFVSPADGSEFTVEMVGEGKDNSDKSASKAASMACKYALFQALMIPFEQVDESDAVNDAVAESYPTDRAARNEVTSAGIAAGYTPAAPQQAPPQTSEEKAATLVRWVQEVQAQPAVQALGLLDKAKQRAVDHQLEDILVEGVPVKLHIATGMQVANANIARAAQAAGSQGVSRQQQQSGEGARAAGPEPEAPPAPPIDPDMAEDLETGTSAQTEREQYEAALAMLRHGEGLRDDQVFWAESIVNAYEANR